MKGRLEIKRRAPGRVPRSARELPKRGRIKLGEVERIGADKESGREGDLEREIVARRKEGGRKGGGG